MGRATRLALVQAAGGNIAPWQPGPLGHYGFVAQNIEAVFPALEEEDSRGYSQTAYGACDAMTVAATSAL